MPKQRPIDRAFFRKTEDGTTIFFPWGLTYRGYELKDAATERRASRAASTLISGTVGIGVWTAYLLQPLVESQGAGLNEILRALVAPGAALLMLLLFYALWVSRLVEGSLESDLKLSREERLREAAELAGPGKVALIGLVTCSLSGLLIWLEPRAWWVGLLGVALGIAALVWSSVLRRAAGHPSR